jgi:hypothetical protein
MRRGGRMVRASLALRASAVRRRTLPKMLPRLRKVVRHWITRTRKAPLCRAFRCAEEDSNLHPVIPDQALNLVTRLSYPSRSRQIVRIVQPRERYGRIGRSGCCHECCRERVHLRDARVRRKARTRRLLSPPGRCNTRVCSRSGALGCSPLGRSNPSPPSWLGSAARPGPGGGLGRSGGR